MRISQLFSFVFGLLSADHTKAARKAGILLIGTATAPEEAQALEDSGVDAITPKASRPAAIAVSSSPTLLIRRSCFATFSLNARGKCACR